MFSCSYYGLHVEARTYVEIFVYIEIFVICNGLCIETRYNFNFITFTETDMSKKWKSVNCNGLRVETRHTFNSIMPTDIDVRLENYS